MARVKRYARGWFRPDGTFEEGRGPDDPWSFDSKLALGYVFASPIFTGVGRYMLVGKREAIEAMKDRLADTLGLTEVHAYDEARFYLGEFSGEEFRRTPWPEVVGRSRPPGLENFGTDMTRPAPEDG